MSAMTRLLALLASLCLVAAACGDDDGDAAATTTSTTSTSSSTSTSSTSSTTVTTTSAALSDLALLDEGGFAVGATTITVDDPTRERPLTVEVWFPIEPGAAGEPHRYDFVTGDYYESPVAVTADADAAASGPFPLVVYSHGSGGLRYIHSEYTETIASHGHVVVAPDHTGNTAVERITETSDPRSLIAYNRPLDVQVVIDAFTDPAHPAAGPFVPLVDADRIAVTGHSFGGFTTYAVVAGYENDQGTVPADERVDAIIPLAPAVGDGGADGLLSDDDLARVTVPSLVIVGTDDITTPVDLNVTRAWEQSASEPHHRLELVAAEHQSFTDLCAYLDFFPTLDEPTPIVLETIETMSVEGCSPDDMAIERVQELTNTFAVAFLESVFRDGEMIDPGLVDLPVDIVFQTK